MMNKKSSFHFSSSVVVVLTSLLLSASFPRTVTATGKGSIGVYSVDNRHILITDSNLDALILLDTLRGGRVVSYRLLHDEDDNDNEEKWIDPTGIASCPDCDFLFMTSTHGRHFYRISMDMSLREMIKTNDFSSFENAPLDPVWPWQDVMDPNNKVRMLQLSLDGKVGYVANFDYGLFQFDPNMALDADTNSDGGESSSSSSSSLSSSSSSLSSSPSSLNRQLLKSQEIPGEHVSGLSWTPNHSHMMMTTPDMLSMAKINHNINDNNEETNDLKPLEISTSFDLGTLCTDAEGVNAMHFRDVALWDNILYAVGHHSFDHGNYGMALYKIVKDNENGGTYECSLVAGEDSSPPGWVDGLGNQVRFSRPHSMTWLASNDGNDLPLLVITDIDNRCVRLVNLIPTSPGYGTVTTLAYDLSLSQKVYGGATSTTVTPAMQGNLRGLAAASTSTFVNENDSQSFQSFSIIHDALAGYEHESALKEKEEQEQQAAEQQQQFQTHSLNDAQNYCQEQYTNGQLCNAETIQDMWDPAISRHEQVSFWTSTSCSSCWLQGPGLCPEYEIETQESRIGSSWGKSYKMVATLVKETGQISLSCTHEEELVEVTPICCTTAKHG